MIETFRPGERPGTFLQNADIANGAATPPSTETKTFVARPEFIGVTPGITVRPARNLEAILGLPQPETGNTVGFTPESFAEAVEHKIMKGKTAVVIGAGPGNIGGETARILAMFGANVVMVSRGNDETSREKAKQFATQIQEETESEVRWIPVNVTNPDAGKVIADEATKQFGRIDSLVLSAGVRKDRPFMIMDDKLMREIMDTNFNGQFQIARSVIRQMMTQDPPTGTVVGIASTSAEGAPGQANYSGSKGALAGTLRSVHYDLLVNNLRKPQVKIRVNIIRPGLTDTAFLEGMDEQKRQFVLTLSDSDREMSAFEVGLLTAFYASPASGDRSGDDTTIIGIGNPPQITI